MLNQFHQRRKWRGKRNERLKYSDEYKKMEGYQKNVPKENIAFEEGETDARAYLD